MAKKFKVTTRRVITEEWIVEADTGVEAMGRVRYGSSDLMMNRKSFPRTISETYEKLEADKIEYTKLQKLKRIFFKD